MGCITYFLFRQSVHISFISLSCSSICSSFLTGSMLFLSFPVAVVCVCSLPFYIPLVVLFPGSSFNRRLVSAVVSSIHRVTSYSFPFPQLPQAVTDLHMFVIFIWIPLLSHTLQRIPANVNDPASSLSCSGVFSTPLFTTSRALFLRSSLFIPVLGASFHCAPVPSGLLFFLPHSGHPTCALMVTPTLFDFFLH